MICSAGTIGTDDPAGNHGLQVVPAATDAAAMGVDQVTERDRHLFFNIARLVHVAGDAEQLGAGIVRAAETSKPFSAAAQDRPATAIDSTLFTVVGQP
jgi:hypothetical protein